MFYKFTAGYGKQICVILYSVFSALLALKIWLPFVLLAALHVAEYVIKGYKVGKRSGDGIIPSFLNCLCFGFTWWLPLERRLDRSEKAKAQNREQN